MDGNPIEPQCHGGEVRSYAVGWSNHYPTTDDTVERRASVDIASLAWFCVPGRSEDDADAIPPDQHAVGPWLRLWVGTSEHNQSKPSEVLGELHAAVVMDEAAVRALHEQLGEWLGVPKVHPRATQ